MSTSAEQSVIEPPTGARAELLRAALELFLEKGFATTRVEDIAKRAGVSKGAVYLHFATKQEIFAGVVQAGVLAQLEKAEHDAAAFSGSASDLLSRMLHNNLLEFWSSRSSGIVKLLIAESQQFPDIAAEYYRTITGRARQLLEDILRHGIEQGEFPAMDVEYTARAILNSFDYELVLAHSLAADVRGGFDSHRYVDAVLALVTGPKVGQGAS